MACTESATLEHLTTSQCIISLMCRLRRVSESPGVVTASHLSGACINVTFLRKSAPTENQYFKIDQNKIDPSYMVCGRLVATLFRISPPPAWPLSFHCTGQGQVFPTFFLGIGPSKNCVSICFITLLHRRRGGQG